MSVRKVNKKHLMIAIIVALILLLGATIVVYYLINGKKQPTEHLVYDEFEMVGGKISDDTYYILGASNSISFDVIADKDFSYQLTDSEDNKVDSQFIEGDPAKIKAPTTLYEEGKIYKLQLTNGTFKDEKYKGIKQIIFKTNRPAKQEMTLKDEVIKKDIKDVEITEKEIKINSEYKENDIIAIYDNNDLIGVYKLEDENDDKYAYSIPKMEEVFSDIDYYGKEKINLSSYVNDKDFNLFLNSFIHTVYAKEDVTVSKPVWNKKDGTLEVGIIVYTNNKKEFLANHDAKVELTLVLSIDLYRDITLKDYDYALEINYDIKVKNNLNHINDSFNNLYDAIKFKETIENYDTKWLEDSYDNVANDKKAISKSLGKLTVKTEIPGLYLDVDTGVLIDINSKGFINNSLTGKNTLLIGINKDNGLYSSYIFDNKSDVSFVGDEENKIGGTINTKLRFINMFDIDSKIIAGLYTDGKSTKKVNKEDEKVTKIDYDISGDSGFFAKYIIKTTGTDEKTIYDDKVSISKYEKKIKISSKVKEDKKEEPKENDKPTYKYTKEQVREMIEQGYNNLAQNEEWSMMIGTITVSGSWQKTINTENNTLSGTWNYDNSVSYTCSYNYVTKNMTCSNFEEAQAYIKGKCDDMHNDFLTYQETGETDNEDAKEWENLYSDLNACYYEAIPSNAPANFDSDIQKILNNVELTWEDLGVLNEE